MQIAICDDIQKELYFTIDEYGAAINVLAYDITLLDICMPGVLGTDVAEEMLAKSPDMSIVFLTTSDEYAVTAFALNATHYLLKPFSQEQFNEALDRAVKKTEDQHFLSLACVDGMHRVRVTEIVSIESQNHYLRLTLSSGEFLKLRMKLSQMFEELREYSGFIKVGASYVVNLAFVRKISGNTLEMLNGVTISVPRRSGKEVQRAYMDFCREEALK